MDKYVIYSDKSAENRGTVTCECRLWDFRSIGVRVGLEIPFPDSAFLKMGQGNSYLRLLRPSFCQPARPS